MFNNSQVIKELIKREIKARYKQSILGYAWVVLVPLINLVVMSVVFSFFIKVPTGGIPYPMFLFVALVPWTFTANAIFQATKSVLENKTIITKVYLPREVFPIGAIGAKIIDFSLSLIVVLIFMFYYKMPLFSTILYLPLIFLVHLLLVTGISFVLSALNVFYRDIENLLGVILTAWMYLTPVVYPQELVPEKYLPIFNLNPMTPIINSYRNIVLYNQAPPLPSFIYTSLWAVTIFIFGYWFFKRKSKYFADVV